MSVTAASRAPVAARGVKPGIVDCDIHPLLRAPGDIRAYLPPRWAEHFDVYGSHLRLPFLGADLWAKPAPQISRRDAWPPGGGPPGSDLDFMRAQHLDPHNVSHGVLQVVVPSGANQRNLDYGAALCGALNDWQLEKWTGVEKRLHGSLVVPQEYPEGAVAEIRRHGRNPAFVQATIAQRTLEPPGRRRYWPIYAAAVEHGLPIGIHTGGANGHASSAGGWCSYYVESHNMLAHAMQAIVTSFVMEGVFEEFPGLRVALYEGGVAWVPALGWRLDALWQRLRSEVPHVRRPPSDYIRQHFWFSTQPIEAPEESAHLRQVFDWIGWDRLMFASDYPHWDYDDPDHAFKFRMTEAERRQIFFDSAAALFDFDRP